MNKEFQNNLSESKNTNIRVDSYEDIKYGKYICYSIPGLLAQTSTNYGVMFTARHPIEIMRITESHAVAATDAGIVTVSIKKAGSGVAISSGTDLTDAAFDLKSTADVPTIKEGVDLADDRILKENDKIGLLTFGLLTNLSDVNFTIYYKEINEGYVK